MNHDMVKQGKDKESCCGLGSPVLYKESETAVSASKSGETSMNCVYNLS
uniref:Uncharacterized protein n=1 Tax=Arundo donax TaxID=35708 RepID=A0A0A9HP30_ARUDO